MTSVLKTANPKAEAVTAQSLSLQDILGIEHEPVKKAAALRSVELTTGYDDTIRWPLWKTATLIVSLCLGFWITAAAALIYVLG